MSCTGLHSRCLVCLLITWLLLPSCFCEDSHDGHDHGHDDHGHGAKWEWAGVFNVHTDEQYTWIAEKVGGKYADPAMKLLIMPAKNATGAAIHEVEHEAEEIWEGNATHVSALSALPLGVGKLYDLEFNSQASISTFQVLFSTSAKYKVASDDDHHGHDHGDDHDDKHPFVIFAQHFPTEFELRIHYLRDPEGQDAEPEATEPDAAAPNNTGLAILASSLVCWATLIGLVLIVPGVGVAMIRFRLFKYMDAFASGAVLATVFFLIYPESYLNIMVAYPKESVASAWWGSSVLLGFLIPALIEWLMAVLFPEGYEAHHAAHNEHTDGARRDDTPVVAGWKSKVIDSEGQTDSKPEGDAEDPSAGATKKPCWPMNAVAWSVLLGDGMHNFGDGVLIGVAFKLCEPATGWTVAAASVLHELAAELSEFWLLTDKAKGGLTYFQALLLNFISSLTVVLGALIISFTEITPAVLGALLALGGGTLMYLGIVPIWHGLLIEKPTMLYLVVCTLCFVLGATLIGLVLIGHEHCEAGHAHGDAHAGHNH
uniref:Uncharacterized protein n=1 Tax=Eutreptiella gymnastica TaxID=73025 RepID=A0A7S4G737_9EUGL|eukprot:CAMPEP_0174302510 /NCGR_PEP_ID=MMETSP0809-20121228/59669_1 /TAXON_ID=73025 ORGANISM="Eutreptiella gymnastica-like, Strain CCMP1594" /NCGR_SAMPLE_ID=MMETSP0809 /ASSEMBLY_ACC=CAM_ASM_000658 /LENGTH=540 /DNA_ID=CAMNT_0015408427 /DNA_START=34 /DNA_END=1656 /DNA_ORIENTATION=-